MLSKATAPAPPRVGRRVDGGAISLRCRADSTSDQEAHYRPRRAGQRGPWTPAAQFILAKKSSTSKNPPGLLKKAAPTLAEAAAGVGGERMREAPAQAGAARLASSWRLYAAATIANSSAVPARLLSFNVRSFRLCVRCPNTRSMRFRRRLMRARSPSIKEQAWRSAARWLVHADSLDLAAQAGDGTDLWPGTRERGCGRSHS